MQIYTSYKKTCMKLYSFITNANSFRQQWYDCSSSLWSSTQYTSNAFKDRTFENATSQCNYWTKFKIAYQIPFYSGLLLIYIKKENQFLEHGRVKRTKVYFIGGYFGLNISSSPSIWTVFYRYKIALVHSKENPIYVYITAFAIEYVVFWYRAYIYRSSLSEIWKIGRKLSPEGTL